MSKSNQSLLARFAVLVSVFALLMVVAVAVTNKDDGGGGGGSSSEGATVPIALTEFKLTPAAISVPEGGKIEVTNNGTVAHNLAITGTDLKIKDIDPKGKPDVVCDARDEATLAREGDGPITHQRSLDLRYRGSDGNLNVPYHRDPRAQEEAFTAAHTRALGWAREGHPIEACTLRLFSTLADARPTALRKMRRRPR